MVRMKMKEKFSIICKCILILVLGAVAGTILLTASFFVPVNRENAASSLDMQYLEGEYPLANVLNNHGDTYFTSYEPAVLDDVTDLLMLQTAFQEQDENPLVMAMDMRNYPRYWHGYIAIIRPLFYFINYLDFRVLNCFIQLLLVFGLAFTIWKHTSDKRYVLAFFTSYALLMPLALPFSMQYSWVFYIAFGGSLLAMQKNKSMLEKSRYLYFFLIMGMLTSFFDLLTYPLAAWGFPLIWWIVSCGNAMDGKERMKKIILSGLGWIAGYGGFWFLKWVIATPILGYNVITHAISEVFYRVGEVDEYAKGLLQAYDRWEVFYTNWRHYEYTVYGVILVAWILWAVYHSFREGWRVQCKSGALFLIMGSSVVWYFVLSNHTTIHHFFTYRIFGVSILALLVYLLECIPAGKNIRRKRPAGQYAATLAAWIVFFLMGYGLTSFAKEDVTAIYGGEYQELTLKEGEALETAFIPTFSNVRNIGFCINEASGQGYYSVTLLEEEEALYRTDIPLSNHVDGAYFVEEVDWNLEAGKEYRIRISIHESDGETDVLITPAGVMPLNEYRNVSIGGNQLTKQQPLGGIEYHTMVQSRLRRGYGALMIMTFLGAAAALVRTSVFGMQKRDGNAVGKIS